MNMTIIIILLTAPSLGRSPDVSCVCELPYPPASKYYIKSTDNDKNIAFKPKIFHLLVCGEAAQQETGPVPHHVLRAALGRARTQLLPGAQLASCSCSCGLSSEAAVERSTL